MLESYSFAIADMESNSGHDKKNAKFGAESIASNICAILFGLGLLSILFYIPGPVIPVTHPYKAELVLAFCLLVTLVVIRLSGVRLIELFGGVGENSLRISAGFLVFLLLGSVSAIWAFSYESVFHHTAIWALYTAFFLTIASIVRWQKGIQFPLVAVATAAAITGTLCLIDYATYEQFSLVESFIRVRYGKYAELTSTLAPFLVGAAFVTKGRVRWFAAIAASLAWLVSMLALSKGAFIAGCVGLTIFFVGSVFSRSIQKRSLIAVIGTFWLAFTIGFQVLFSVTSDIPATADYISGAVDPTQTSANFRTYIWKTGLQMGLDHWIVGIGADGFGRQFNNGTARFRANSPNDTAPEYAEDRLVERAHNEPIQIFAELGVLGLVVFSIPFIFAGTAVSRSLKSGNDLLLWTVIASSVAFFISSLVSSFSFRSAQNGIAYLFVLAAVIGMIDRVRDVRLSKRSLSLVVIGVFAASLFAMTYSATKIGTESYVSLAENTIDNEASLAAYRKALQFDPEYAGAWLSLAARHASMNEYENAAFATQKGIDNGIGMSLTYSQLATQYKIAGFPEKAAEAYREGVRVYPRSTYLRIEAAEYMRSIGLEDEAKANTEAAIAVDAKQAEGWIRLIRYRGTKAFHMSKDDGMSTPPAELLPQNTVQMYIDPPPKPPE